MMVWQFALVAIPPRISRGLLFIKPPPGGWRLLGDFVELSGTFDGVLVEAIY